MREFGEENVYSMGAVAEQTGLSAPNIRVWEKRYGAVTPQRTDTNRRLYTRDDVERLIMLRRLTERGHAISQVAGLADAELRRILHDAAQSDDGEGSSLPRRKVAVVGAGAAEMLEDLDLFEADVVGKAGDLDEVAAQEKLPQVDLLIAEVDSLFLEGISTLRTVVERCGAELTLVVYRFASSKTVTALAKTIAGVRLVKAPVNDIQLRRECLVMLNLLRADSASDIPVNPGPIPEKLYTSDQLTRLSKISSTVECECPRHMAELLLGLSAFEKYSEECEDQNPEDALLHAFLHRTTAQVRRSMEEALRHLIHSEGLTLD